MNDNNKISVSIIIPVYNGARFLRATLDSIFSQTFQEYELILVNDGSTDDTAAIIEAYEKKDSRIRVYYQENAGMSKARDLGVNKANLDTWLLFLDADDIFHPQMLESLVRQADDDIDLVVSCYENHTEKAICFDKDVAMNSEKQLEYSKISGKEMFEKTIHTETNAGSLGTLWGILINRSFYNRMEPVFRQVEAELSQNYLNDVFCIPRFFLNADKVVFINKVLINHRLSKHTDSRTLKPNALHYELAKASELNLKFFKEKNMLEAYNNQLISFYFTILKIWYQANVAEIDRLKGNEYMHQMEAYYSLYYSEFSMWKTTTVRDRLVKLSIQLFRFSPKLWEHTVGDLRYGFMYQLK